MIPSFSVWRFFVVSPSVNLTVTVEAQEPQGAKKAEVLLEEWLAQEGVTNYSHTSEQVHGVGLNDWLWGDPREKVTVKKEG